MSGRIAINGSTWYGCSSGGRRILRRYRDFNGYLRELFGERVQKVSLDAGLGCPNRDGTISSEGCVYCDPLGSGSGALSRDGVPIEVQIRQGIRAASRRYGARRFIAYFQSFSNTYAPVPVLARLYDRALAEPGVVGLAVGTRPDCVDAGILDLLASYRKRVLVWVEYGLQSAHDATLEVIRRGHDAACFERAVRLTADRGLNVCAHIILGLPGESQGMMMETARYVARLPVHGLKIHGLYVIEETALSRWFRAGGFRCLDRGTYVDLVVDVLERIPEDVVIQRLTGDPPHGLTLVAPDWARDKRKTLERIRERLHERGTWQGKRFLENRRD
ncbi:MAG: TIGR01212 family radical SAM protein [Deltaproteobacteria bacterium]|nr:TIGR01212 family radical SAM protein [Deltaproteobacteria bacterium]